MVCTDRHTGTIRVLGSLDFQVGQVGHLRQRYGPIVSAGQSGDEPIEPGIGHGEIENVGIRRDTGVVADVGVGAMG